VTVKPFTTGRERLLSSLSKGSMLRLSGPESLRQASGTDELNRCAPAGAGFAGRVTIFRASPFSRNLIF
jgi:hypothetical protein